MDMPETRYAKTVDGVHIAYQVVGEGPVDLVYVSGWISNVDLNWTHPDYARFLRRLGSFSRPLGSSSSTSEASDYLTECPTRNSQTSRPGWMTSPR
jgi:hypothetical protein